MARTKLLWRDKRCPKCGSEIDPFGTCRKCSRAWSEKLDESELAFDVNGKTLEPGQQHEAFAPKPELLKKTTKPRGRKHVPFTDDPPQFKQWEIHVSDDEPEIIRKRSLMHLESRKMYSAMGLAVRAHEAQKVALLWLSRMWEFLDNDERASLGRVADGLKVATDVLSLVRNSKVAQTARMEKAMEKAWAQARKARMAAIDKNRKKVSALVPQDSEGLGPQPVAIDSQELMDQAKERLLELDKQKGAAKDRRRRESAPKA
jgi:hypothetical protein